MTTNSYSRKVFRLRTRPQATLIVEAREPEFEQGVAGRGAVTSNTGAKVAALRDPIRERNLTEKAMSDPQIAGFFASFDDTMLRLTPNASSSRDMGQLNRQFCRGNLATETGSMYPLDSSIACGCLPARPGHNRRVRPPGRSAPQSQLRGQEQPDATEHHHWRAVGG